MMIDNTKMTLQGHVLIVEGEPHDLLDFAIKMDFRQFSLADDNGWKLSAPLSIRHQVSYSWLYHKMKGLEKPPTPPKGGGKPPKGPTPPAGGSPAAGQQYVETELLMAVA